MKKRTLIIGTLFVLLTVVAISCTDQEMARNFGGTVEVAVPENNVFINATWKDTELWYITKDTTDGSYHLRQQKSGWSMSGNGQVIFKP